MKNRKSLCTPLVVLLSLSLLLSGCAVSGNGGTDAATTVPTQAIMPNLSVTECGSDTEGISLQLLSYELGGEAPYLEVQWKNDTAYEVIYGAHFDIEKKTDAQWVSCAPEDLAAIDIAYLLAPGGANSQTYSLKSFDLSDSGTYRLITSCNVMTGTEESANYRLWVEFTLGETAVSGQIDRDSPLLYGSGEQAFSAQYIRTNGYHDGVDYPIVTVIHSTAELNNYYEKNKNFYDLGRKDTVYSDTTIGFSNACDKYDDAYFEENTLVLVLLEEGSGSVRHSVTNVTKADDGTLVIAIERIMPEVGTCDMAEWHILIELDSSIGVFDESDITVLLNGQDSTRRSKTVSCSHGYANLSIDIPNGWEYEVVEYSEDTASFGICFRPAGQTEGWIRFYYTKFFGVCGTGLKTEEITLNRHSASQGTYDSSKVWDYIVFNQGPGKYVILNEGATQWLAEYASEVMSILDTVVIADGIITEAQAIEIARQKDNAPYDSITADFDLDTGIWTVTMSGDETRTVNIDAFGRIIYLQ